MTDTIEAPYRFSNVPAGTHIKEFGDVIHKLVQSAPWSEGDKVAAQQVVTDEFGHPTPIKEFAIAAATAVQQNDELRAQMKAMEKKAAEREAAFNARLDGLLAAFAAAGINPTGSPSGSGQGAKVNVPEAATEISTTAAEEAATGFAAWKAKKDAEKAAGVQPE